MLETEIVETGRGSEIAGTRIAVGTGSAFDHMIRLNSGRSSTLPTSGSSNGSTRCAASEHR